MALKLADNIKELRNEVSPLIKKSQALASDRPRCGAEITLATRALQTARMWLGVAEAMEKGLDPWENQVKE